jgi:hypothetical protein
MSSREIEMPRIPFKSKTAIDTTFTDPKAPTTPATDTNMFSEGMGHSREMQGDFALRVNPNETNRACPGDTTTQGAGKHPKSTVDSNVTQMPNLESIVTRSMLPSKYYSLDNTWGSLPAHQSHCRKKESTSTKFLAPPASDTSLKSTYSDTREGSAPHKDH